MDINTAEYMVGIPAIDNQHEHYVKLIKKLLLAYGDKKLNKTNIIDYFNEIDIYALEHLSSEEALMRGENYPYYEAHLKNHNKFREMIDNFEEELQQEELDLDDFVNRLCGCLIDWFKSDLLRDDTILAKYLKEKA